MTLYKIDQDTQIDEFGVDHSNFSLRDEIEYNTMRAQEKEQRQSFVNRQNFRQAGQSTPITAEEASYLTTPLQSDYGQAATLQFDGQNLTWQQNGRPVKSWPAMSGHSDFQSAQFTDVANEGPIPEGNYLLGQGTGQDYEDNLLNKVNRWAVHNKNIPDFLSVNNWTATPAAWGHQRIPIQPQQGTNTFGRHSMYIHGGDNGYGSAGCIDLERNMPTFYNDFKNYDGEMPLSVKYPKGW